VARQSTVAQLTYQCEDEDEGEDERLALGANISLFQVRYNMAEESQRMAKVQDLLGRALAVPGVRAVALVGREGLRIETAGRGAEGLFEALGALGASALNVADALGQEIGQGLLISVITEYERGLVSITPYGEYAAVVTLIENAASLGGLRQILRAIEPEVLRALDQS